MANLNVLAYLLTLGNIQSMSGGAIDNLSVKLGDLHSLKSDLLTLPDFNVNNFRETGYYRVGNIGKYLSQNLRDYIYYGIGEPTDEGVILTIRYNPQVLRTAKPDDNTLSFLLNREPVDGNVEEQLTNYLDDRLTRRQRSITARP